MPPEYWGLKMYPECEIASWKIGGHSTRLDFEHLRTRETRNRALARVVQQSKDFESVHWRIHLVEYEGKRDSRKESFHRKKDFPFG